MSLNPDSQTVLRASGINMIFPGVHALKNVDFSLHRGEIHSLLGENGAGKSTLIKVLTGVYQPTSGTMNLAGRDIRPTSTADAERHGIATVYQEVNLVPQRSVAENICMGRFPKSFGFIRWGQVKQLAKQALARLSVNIDVTQPLSSYSIAIQQMVAIARAVGTDTDKTRVLILDEPTSSLDTAEVQQLFKVMTQLRDQGMGIVFVTHFLDQVYQVSDRITVLRNGGYVGTWRATDLPRLSLVSAMVGKELEGKPAGQSHSAAAADAQNQKDVISINNLGRRGMMSPVSFKIPRGSSIGLAGLLGSGRSETARLIFGADIASEGTVSFNNQLHRFKSPRSAICNDIAMTTEDRKAHGIFPNLSVRENIAIAVQARRGILRRISSAEQKEMADRYVKSLAIKTPHIEQSIGNLSGGNQQKCLLGRWLATKPRLLILDEPTRGIDIGAKAEIRKVIDELCLSGMAVLFISSELEEVVDVCDQIIILRDRKQIAQIAGSDASPEKILHLIADVAPVPVQDQHSGFPVMPAGGSR